jgi:protein-tyrosine phosphatase
LCGEEEVRQTAVSAAFRTSFFEQVTGGMIDIHNHGLYGVDDGADSLKESLAMLRYAEKQGITDVIFTPHYRRGMFMTPVERIEEHFRTLQEALEKRRSEGRSRIRVYLGCEYHVDHEITEYLRRGRVHALNDGTYVLAEYSFETAPADMQNSIDDILANGWIPVVAHVERYRVFIKDPAFAGRLRQMGALIQVNADALTGRDGFRVKAAVSRLMKLGCVDVVASDAHGIKNRASHMREAYDRLEKKYGRNTAEQLMCINPGMILNSEED